MSRFHFTVGMLALGAPAAALAQAETTTFEYDAQGRLTESSRVGGPASGVTAAISYDAAGNRINQTVTGASGAAPLGAPEGAEGGADEAADEAAPGAADYVAPTSDPPVSQGAPLPGESPPADDAAEPDPGA